MTAGAEVIRLMNDARTRLPGSTDTLLQQELFMVMDEFFKASNVWKEDIPVPIGGQDPPGTIYYLSPQEPGLIDKLMWVFQQPDPTTAMLRGSQWGVAMSVPGELTLNFQPSSAITVVATVALTVQDPVNRDGYVVFPLWILQKYRNVILDGLLGRMMVQKSKPWTDSQMSVYHLRKFETGKAHARVDGTRNNTYRQQAWRFPSYGVGTQRGRSSTLFPPQ